MRKFKSIIYLSLSILIFSCNKGKKTVFPVKKDLTQSVYASGKLMPINDYKVYAKFPGYVKTIHVKVGSLVKAGDPLITIRNDQSEFSATTAKNNWDLALKNASSNSPVLQALKNEINTQKAKYELDSINYYRYAVLIKQQATTQVLVDQAKSQFEISRQSWLRSANNYNSTRDRLNTEAANAELQYKTLQVNKNEYVILADQDGMVYDIDINTGEMISLQKAIMEIGNANSFELELNIDETDIFLVKQGQVVAFTVDAYKDEVFKGTVKEIYPRISQGNKTSRVIAGIEQHSDVKFYSSLSAEANIVISSNKNVLVIPREYIKEGNKVKIKGKEEMISVKKGVEDIEYVEILDGLKESDELQLQ
ncbi:MAG: efflux RND transporter periplasmic adaptor subunit [Bacteroidota bacterium]|jgi:HlyD family secretion protein